MPVVSLMHLVLMHMQALWQLAAVSKSAVYARQEAAASMISSAKKHSDADPGVQRLLQRFPEVLEQFIRLCNHSGGDKRCVLMQPRPMALPDLVKGNEGAVLPTKSGRGIASWLSWEIKSRSGHTFLLPNGLVTSHSSLLLRLEKSARKTVHDMQVQELLS